MTIFNLGSINADNFYAVPRLPAPGETIAATDFSFGLGGKGANQSIAAATGGAEVVHIGAVGEDGHWAVDQLASFGISIDHIDVLDIPTGHANICVDPDGENSIVIFSSANIAQSTGNIRTALAAATDQDICILQNETNNVAYAAEIARNRGMRVIYSAAPFDVDAVEEVLPFVDMVVLNTVEAEQLSTALGVTPQNLPVPAVLVTMGADGAIYRTSDGEDFVPAFEVTPVDTTGAGDTYLGFFAAGLDAGMDHRGAMRFAAAGAAIQVTRHGTADAIPSLPEVKEFLETRLAPKARAG